MSVATMPVVAREMAGMGSALSLLSLQAVTLVSYSFNNRAASTLASCVQ